MSGSVCLWVHNIYMVHICLLSFFSGTIMRTYSSQIVTAHVKILLTIKDASDHLRFLNKHCCRPSVGPFQCLHVQLTLNFCRIDIEFHMDRQRKRFIGASLLVKEHGLTGFLNNCLLGDVEHWQRACIEWTTE